MLQASPEQREYWEMYDNSDDYKKVRIAETDVGKGVFALVDYPVGSVIGEIEGDIIHDSKYGSDYCIDLENGCQLEPYAPFRFVNHSCDPNCEFDWFDDIDSTIDRLQIPLYLIAIRNIYVGEELTIDYNWPSENAIRCQCNSPLCRGWVVSLDEIDDVEDPDFGAPEPFNAP